MTHEALASLWLALLVELARQESPARIDATETLMKLLISGNEDTLAVLGRSEVRTGTFPYH